MYPERYLPPSILNRNRNLPLPDSHRPLRASPGLAQIPFHALRSPPLLIHPIRVIGMAEEQIKLPLAPVHNGLSPAILSATLGSDAKPIRLGLNVVCAASPGRTEHKFDFSEVPEGQPPPGFRSTVTGRGKPGDWKIILDEVPSGMAKLTPQGRSVSRRKILAALA